MGARAGHFAGGSLGAQAPSLARRVSTSSLDPRRTPASRDRRPSASKGLKHKGPGWEQPVYVAENTETPPSRPHHCEDPPVLPSVKVSPLTDARTGGQPAGDGIFRAIASWFIVRMLGGASAWQAPHQKAPSGQLAPILKYQARFTGSLGRVRGTGRFPCHPEDRALSWRPHFQAGLSPPQRQSAQGRPGHLGPGRTAGHGSVPDGDGPCGRVAGPWKSSPMGTQACVLLRG